MKLNDFLDKSPRPRSTPQKIITVANEKKENELIEEIQTLQKEVERLHSVDFERSDFNQRMQAAEIQLHETLEREAELKNTKALLETEIDQYQELIIQKQRLEAELRDTKGQLGITEATLETATTTSQELNRDVIRLSQELDRLQVEDSNLKNRL